MVCSGRPTFSAQAVSTVGGTTLSLTCDTANRHVRHRFFALVDRTSVWQVVLAVQSGSGAPTSCTFSGTGIPEKKLSCAFVGAGGPVQTEEGNVVQKVELVFKTVKISDRLRYM